MLEVSKTTPCSANGQSQNMERATALFQKLDDDMKDRVLDLLRMMVASKE